MIADANFPVGPLKKKNRHVNSSKEKNNYSDVSTWTCECYKSFLKSCKAVQQGNKNELIDRCELLKHLIENGLEILISLSKTELKSMSSTLSLPCTPDISKDDIIQDFFNVMLEVCGDTSNNVLAMIE